MQPANVAAYCRPAIARALSFVEPISGNTQIIVDLSNMTIAGRAAGFRLDYTEVLRHLCGDNIIHPTVVASLPPLDSRNPWKEAFYAYLRRVGYHVDTFFGEKQPDGTLAEDELRVDGRVRHYLYTAVEDSDIDSVVLLAGDGGYTNAVKALRRTNKRVYVIAWDGSAHPALIAAATAFSTVQDLRPLIGRLFH